MDIVEDALDAMVCCERIVRYQHPELPGVFDQTGIHFVYYGAEEGIVIFSAYLYAEELLGEAEYKWGFVVLRIADDEAYLVLPEPEDQDWWPDAYRQEGGDALPVELCHKLIAVAFP